MKTEALKLALEALEKLLLLAEHEGWEGFDNQYAAITAIKEALSSPNGEAQPEKTVCPFCSSEWVTAEQHDRKMDMLEQEPVALETVYETIIQWDEGGGKRSRRELARRIVSLYTTPPPVAEPHKRKPLTDEKVSDQQCRRLLYGFMLDFNAVGFEQAGRNLHRAMKEAAHGIKE